MFEWLVDIVTAIIAWIMSFFQYDKNEPIVNEPLIEIPPALEPVMLESA
jgi:hypothetical protein